MVFYGELGVPLDKINHLRALTVGVLAVAKVVGLGRSALCDSPS